MTVLGTWVDEQNGTQTDMGDQDEDINNMQNRDDFGSKSSENGQMNIISEA
jgi:hypothetical protein